MPDESRTESVAASGNAWVNRDFTDSEPLVFGNSHGGGVSVDHTPPGRYSVKWPDLGALDGNAQANAAGVPSQRTCIVESWLPISGDQFVDVACRGISGPRRDAPSAVSYTNQIGLKGDGGSAWAYLVADRPGGRTTSRWRRSRRRRRGSSAVSSERARAITS